MPARRLVLPEQLTTLPFTLQTARATGLGRPALHSVGVQRLAPRVYTAAEPTLIHRAAAHLVTMTSDVLVEGLTALQLHGVDLGPAEPLRFCSPDAHRVRRAGVRVRRINHTPPSVSRVLTPPAAFATAVADLGLVDSVVAGDWLVRLKKTTPAALQEYAADLTGRHCCTIRRAAGLVRERVESPPESRLRLCLVLAGLPEPACNVDLGDENFFVARPDLVYLVHRLLLEYEGDQHRTDKKQWQRDIERERELRRLGFELVRVTAATMRQPRQLVEAVHELLVQRGYDGPAPVYSPEWLSHFELGNPSGRSGRLHSA